MSATVWWLGYCLVLPFLGIGMKIDPFQSCGHCWVFQICWHNECKILMASSFKDSNSSAEISFHPLALLTAVLLKVHLTSQFTMSGSGWLTTHCSHPVHKDLFCSVLLCILSNLCWSPQGLLGLYHFYPFLMFPTFLKKSLVFPLFLFSSIIKHCSLKKAYLSLLKITAVSQFSQFTWSVMSNLLWPHGP